MTTVLSPHILFGSSKPFVPPAWTTTDDRIRGGASISHLDPLPNNCARFYGHLDTSTLGGAGFASQFSPEDGSWDLSAYDGIELEFQEGDGKVYTFILKDEEMSGKRDDGREKAVISWEVEFRAGQREEEEKEEGDGSEAIKKEKSAPTRVWVPWEDFKATYRGKEKKDAGELKTGEVKRVGIMMRSYFGMQEGDFDIELKSILARKLTDGDEARRASVLMRNFQVSISGSTDEETQRSNGERKKGWLEFFFGPLYGFTTITA
ncbi:hypothetical protein JMJ35_007936 [Cladonia borealis]|uniref:NADH:ubiquinone oxidoreductase intermediate-associated protein 30 domain-containing protein n=1 Tax=Cladonia borealis TaxID=184061 RepID=A0AA39QUL3_9LECA|nr:hypothetical protein JMJ35_007936 [Cladonia borealis]